MTAGDIEVLGPFELSEIDAGLTGSVVVADLIVPLRHGRQWAFVVVKAA